MSREHECDVEAQCLDERCGPSPSFNRRSRGGGDRRDPRQRRTCQPLLWENLARGSEDLASDVLVMRAQACSRGVARRASSPVPGMPRNNHRKHRRGHRSRVHVRRICVERHTRATNRSRRRSAMSMWSGGKEEPTPFGTAQSHVQCGSMRPGLRTQHGQCRGRQGRQQLNVKKAGRAGAGTVVLPVSAPLAKLKRIVRGASCCVCRAKRGGHAIRQLRASSAERM